MTRLAGLEILLVTVVLSNLLLLGSSRLNSAVRLVALQGLAAGLLPLLMHLDGNWARAVILCLANLSLKAVVFPLLLLRLLRAAGIRREVEPFVGFIPSLIAGVGAIVSSYWIMSRLDLPGLNIPAAALAAPAGLATLLIGLFLLVSRRTAVSQVLGYIVIENGIYVFGMALVGRTPMLVELGVLMDAFVAVFIMTIAVNRISREFDHVDVDQLDRLKG